MPLKTIKDTRKELARWGNFWRHKEFGNGYSSVSPTARICETLRTECMTQGTSHLVNHLADNIFEPDDIKYVGDAISKLSSQCKQAVVAKYVKRNRIVGYFIDEAERLIMIELS